MNEFDSFVSKTNFEWSEQIKDVGVFLPRLIQHVADSNFQDKKRVAIHEATSAILDCCTRIITLENDAWEYQNAFLLYLTNRSLTINQETRLLQSGLYYFDEDMKLCCAYPPTLMITKCFSMINHQNALTNTILLAQLDERIARSI